MADGRVLVAGGADGVNRCCMPTEIYDPSADTWVQLPPIDPTYNVAYPLLLAEDAGTWLMVGGTYVTHSMASFQYGNGSYFVARLDTNNRTSERVAAIGSDPTGTIDPKGTWAIGELDDQHFLMVNFQDRVSTLPSSRTQTYDRKTWTPSSGPSLEQAGRQRLMVKLRDGRLLVLGGRYWVDFWDSSPRAWVEGSVKLILESIALEPGQDHFKQIGSTRTHFRQPYSQLLALPSGGAVAIAGQGPGVDAFYGGSEYVETFDPQTDTWTPRGSMTASRAFAAAQLLRDERVLIAGGGQWDASRPTQSADLLDLATGRWYDAGPMSVPRIGPASVRLADGRILVIGGDEEGTAEIFSLNPDALPSTRYIPLVQSRPRR